MKFVGRVLITSCTAMLLACANTESDHYVDPELANWSGSNVVVLSTAANKNLSRTVESQFVTQLEKKDMVAARYHQVFPPTKEYTPKQILEGLVEKGYDAIVVVDIESADRAEWVGSYTTTTTGNATANTSFFGNQASTNVNSNSSTITTANKYSKMTTNAVVTVVESTSGKTVSVTNLTVEAGGSLYTNIETAAIEIAVKATDDMQSSSMFRVD